eukprot:Pgem_evm1s7112
MAWFNILGFALSLSTAISAVGADVQILQQLQNQNFNNYTHARVCHNDGKYINITENKNSSQVLNGTRPIQLAYFHEYHFSRIVSLYAKYLIEETLGYKVDLIEVKHNDNHQYLDDINSGKYDAHLSVYTDEAYDYKNPKFKNLGNVGFQSRLGWYMPDYMINSEPGLIHYKGWKNVQSHETIFCQNESAFNYSSFDYEAALKTKDCANATTPKKCIDFLKKHSTSRVCKLQFLSDPDSIEYGMDSHIIRNLKLDSIVNITHIDSQVDHEKFKNDYVQDALKLYKPFMINVKEPSIELAVVETKHREAIKNNVAASPNLIRVHLEEFDYRCNEHYFTDSYSKFACDYKAQQVGKVISTSLGQNYPEVERLLHEFHLHDISFLNKMLFDSTLMSEEDAVCKFINEHPSFVEEMNSEKDVHIVNTISEPLRITFMVIGGIMFFFCSFNSILIFQYRKNSNIIRGSYTFLMLICLCSCVYSIWIILVSLPTNNIVCGMEPWFYLIGFCGAFLALNMKTFRVSLLFNRKLALKASRSRRIVKNLKDDRLVIYYAVMMGLIILYLAVWTGISTTRPWPHLYSSEKVSNHNIFTFETICASSPVYEYIAIGIEFFVVLISVMLAVSVRNIPTNFNESTLIGVASYGAALCVLVNVAIHFVTVNNTTAYILKIVFSILPIFALVVTIVSRKLYNVYKGIEDESKSNSSQSQSKSGNTGILNSINNLVSKAYPSKPNDNGHQSTNNRVKQNATTRGGKSVVGVLKSVHTQDNDVSELILTVCESEELPVDGGIYDGDDDRV